MKPDTSIEEIALWICDGISGAIETYARISGADIALSMPEHFLHSYVLLELGKGPQFTATMETPGKHLRDWNADARQRRNMQPESVFHTPVPEYPVEIDKWKADLVLCTPLDQSGKADLIALVEFKKDTLSKEDEEKLQKWLPWLDTCPWGIVCGYVKEKWGPADLNDFREQVKSLGHNIATGRPAKLTKRNESYHTFAEILSNPAYQPSPQP